MSGPDAALLELARLYGVQPSYEERPGGPQHHATPETLLAVLRALGAPVDRLGDVQDALRAKRAERRLVQPVTVVWGDVPEGRSVSLPAASDPADDEWELTLTLESGETREWRWAPARPTAGATGIPLAGPLPFGYHQLTARSQGREERTWLFCAPERTWEPEPAPAEACRDVGLFLPLYALHTERSWGTGDLTDLATLLDWAARRDLRFLGTLPLLATFLGGGRAPVEPGPYAPASRLFWNELYLDVERAPGLGASGEAQRLLGSATLRRELDELRGGRRARYAESMALKRRVLEPLARDFAPAGDPLPDDMAAFAERREDALPYARFRAAMERHGPPWQSWPAGAATQSDMDGDAVRYHLYVQWALERQIASLAGSGRRVEHGRDSSSRTTPDLYLDLPLGSHRQGFDGWRFEGAFVPDLSVGAPPDPLQLAGQDWGFAPLHPERTRASGHVYFRRSVELLMRVAGMLRLDHVMSLHRLYCIPAGRGPLEGAYVRYAFEDLYAVLCIESNRRRCEVIGEDLGTVPTEVRENMARHAVGGMYLLAFELAVPEADSGEAPRLPPPDPRSIASLGTHDLPPFAAYATGEDVREHLEDGSIDQEQATTRLEERSRWFQAVKTLTGSRPEDGPREVLPRALRTLANTAARHLLVNVEDLWGETESQNRPGTVTESNWSLRAKVPLEAWSAVPDLEETLASLAETRKRAPSGARSSNGSAGADHETRRGPAPPGARRRRGTRAGGKE